MKNIANRFLPALLITASCLIGCGESETSNEKTGDEVKTQDSSQLNNYDNEHPNDRIHLQDTNAAKDSGSTGSRPDSIRK